MSDAISSKANIISATERLSPSDATHTVVKLGPNLVAKYGPQVTLAEAKTMQYIAEHSQVPVPKVHEILEDPETDTRFFVMDLVAGQTLASLLPTLSAAEKDDIAQEIKIALEKLRSMPEPGYLGSVGREACTHGMFWGPDGPEAPSASGPFDSEAEFNEGLLHKLSTMPRMAPSYMELLRKLFSEAFTGHRTVMTHGDLQPKNIMVHKTGIKEDGAGIFKVSFIDWETSGWYPEYWEYCHSIIMGRFKSDWLDMVNKIMPLYGYEFTLMQMIFHILYY